MELTKFTEYSLRVLMYLGLNQDRLVTISEITNAYDVSENHVMKIVPQLAKKGYLETVRGKSGGIRLSRPPHMINVGQVVRDTEENMDLAECFDSSDSNCPMLPGCILKSVLIEARKSFLATLDRYQLSDLLINHSVFPVRAHPLTRKPKEEERH